MEDGLLDNSKELESLTEEIRNEHGLDHDIQKDAGLLMQNRKHKRIFVLGYALEEIDKGNESFRKEVIDAFRAFYMDFESARKKDKAEGFSKVFKTSICSLMILSRVKCTGLSSIADQWQFIICDLPE